MASKEDIRAFHRKAKGKIRTMLTEAISSKETLAKTYTPGVAIPALDIAGNPELVWELTGRRNRVAVVSDGSAVLGLGNIGPLAALPVMEGKAALFKEFADIDAFPICLATQDVDEIVQAVKAIAPSFGGINLEDIAAPRCFAVEEILKRELDIPVFHDDQHGTAIVVLAALINALRVREPLSSSAARSAASRGCTSLDSLTPVRSLEKSDIRIVISGAGAAGTAIASMLLSQGLSHILVVDRTGIINRDRDDLNSKAKMFLAAATNPENCKGSLVEAMKGSDVFIGVSTANLVTKDMVRSMAEDPIVFALANPDPEIMPDDAKEAGAFIVASGRSDFPNQVNNLLAFPGVFRGALDSGAKEITQEMKLAAAKALAACVENPTAEKILPDPLEKEIALRVADAVKNEAIRGKSKVKRAK